MTINMIRRINKASGFKFFDAPTIKFFRSRPSKYSYVGPGGVYFVTSERFVSEPRRYTVRRFIESTGAIDIMGVFNTLTRKQAHYKAGLYCKGVLVA